MPTNMGPADQQAIMLITSIIFLLVAIADFVIFIYWISFKFKESKYNNALKKLAIYPATVHVQTPVPPFQILIPDLPITDLPIPELANPEALQSNSVLTPYTQHLTPELPDTEHLTPELPNPESFQSNSVLTPNTEHLTPLPLPRSPFATTWSLVNPFVGIQVVLFVATVAYVIMCVPVFSKFIFDNPGFMKSQYNLIATTLTLIIQNLAFVGVVAYLVKQYGTSLWLIGLRAPTRREVMLGLAYGAGLIVVSMMIEKVFEFGAVHVVSKQFVDHMSKIEDDMSAGGMFNHIRSIPIQILFILAAAIAAPIGEELFFRGLLYNAIKKRWGISAGVILSGICFGLIHFAPISVIVIIPMGCVLALVYERTKSLWVTILMHALNNGVQLVMAMYFINSSAHH